MHDAVAEQQQSCDRAWPKLQHGSAVDAAVTYAIGGVALGVDELTSRAAGGGGAPGGQLEGGCARAAIGRPWTR